jgi:hypothetical protein
MTDQQRDDTLERDLQALKSAYHAGADAVPPAHLDDAIRAAARRAVHAKPGSAGTSWRGSTSTPLAAAAVLVLVVSVGFLSLDRPEVSELGQAAEAPVMKAAPPGATVPAAKQEDKLPAMAEKKLDVQPDSKDSFAQRQAESTSMGTSGARLAEPSARNRQRSDANVAIAPPPPNFVPPPEVVSSTPPPATMPPAPPQKAAMLSAPAVVSAPVIEATPTPPPSPAPVAPAAPVSRAKETVASEAVIAPKSDARLQALAKRERYVEQSVGQAAQAGQARDEAKAVTANAPAARAPAAFAVAAPPPAVYVPAPPAPQAMQPAPVRSAPPVQLQDADLAPLTWIARIRALKVEGKHKEVDEELVKFRKRYPNYELPEDLRERK